MAEPSLLAEPHNNKASFDSSDFNRGQIAQARGGFSKRIFFLKATVVTLAVVLWLSFRDGYRPFAERQRAWHPDGDHDNKHAIDFDTITPSEKLEWHPCRGEFFCARLTVPMDYHRPLSESPDNPKVHIALLMARGQRVGPKNFSTSPLLINPGGPGGSGTSFAEIAASLLQEMVGLEQDIIGFDPRGIGATTPRLDCFSYPPQEPHHKPSSDFDEDDYVTGFRNRMAWFTSGTGIGLANSSNVALAKHDTRARALAKMCQHKDGQSGKDSIFRYAHTPSVARDMLSIIDAWDTWKDSLECEKTIEINTASNSQYSLDTKGKLVFWGFSYGTLLGATFASMFPDRVGRVALDGVVDADHYVAPVWADSIQNADDIFDSLPKYCYQAKARCALYRPGDKQSDIEHRFREGLAKLNQNDIALVDERSNRFSVITGDYLKSFFFSVLYSPINGFPFVAAILDEVLTENYTILKMLIPLSGGDICNVTMSPWYYPSDAQDGIMCSDKRYPLNETVHNLQERFEKMSKLSAFADVWMTVMMGCDGWGIEAVDPPMKWDDHPAHKLKPIKTSFPLLFLSNTYDPVTPLRAGLKMARKFVDAGLVQQNSMGHCTLAAGSSCTVKKIRKYFNEGKVPPHPQTDNLSDGHADGKWAYCEAEEYPFQDLRSGFGTTKAFYEQEPADQAGLKAMKELQVIFHNFQHRLPNGAFGYGDVSRRMIDAFATMRTVENVWQWL